MDLQQLINNMNKVRADFKLYGKNALRVAFEEFFASAPEVYSIVWTQYTPYFNDGDSCEFTMGEVYFLTKPQNEDDDDEDEPEDLEDSCLYGQIAYKRDGKSWASPPIPPQKLTEREKELINMMDKFLSIFQEETLFQDIFGNHIQVTATRLGFDIEGYEHE